MASAYTRVFPLPVTPCTRTAPNPPFSILARTTATARSCSVVSGPSSSIPHPSNPTESCGLSRSCRSTSPAASSRATTPAAMPRRPSSASATPSGASASAASASACLGDRRSRSAARARASSADTARTANCSVATDVLGRRISSTTSIRPSPASASTSARAPRRAPASRSASGRDTPFLRPTAARTRRRMSERPRPGASSSRRPASVTRSTRRPSGHVPGGSIARSTSPIGAR